MTLALEDIRVVDLSRIWAGPYGTKLLADMGAEIVKIEALDRLDPHRGAVRPQAGTGNYPDGEPGDDPWNRNGWFNSLHQNKYGITLDLSHPQGKDVFRELIAMSDVVIENFRRGVLDKLGFTYEELKKIRPDIVVVSMPAFGNTGVWKDYIQYGIGQEQLAGVDSMGGYSVAEGPIKSGINHGDPITGSHAAGAILAALMYRRRTGKSVLIDLSQLDSSISLMGEHLLDFQMRGQNPTTTGNQHDSFAPQGVFPCLGEDEWVAISVTSDSEWLNLTKALGFSDLGEDIKYADSSLRKQNESELLSLIGEWTKTRDKFDITSTLQSSGIPCAPLMTNEDIYDDPHYQSRSLMEISDHPSTDIQLLPGVGWKMSKTTSEIRWHAPMLGQHNEFIFGELVGLSSDVIANLIDEGVSGTEPVGA